MTPRLHTAAALGQLPKLHVYVDETGDRGFSDRSRQQSPFFAMSALLVPQEEEWQVKVAAGGLRALIHGVQPQTAMKPLHWVEHFRAKHPERRRRAAQTLANMSDVKVIHVITHKDSVEQDAGMRKSKELFYNYTTRLLLERVAYAARGWPEGKRLAIVRLGTVKHMDHTSTLQHLTRVRDGLCDNYGVPWTYIKWPPIWESTQRDGIQLADVHAGLLETALSGHPDDWDCARNLLLCRHQLRRVPGRGALGYGLKIVGKKGFVTGRIWYPDWAAE